MRKYLVVSGGFWWFVIGSYNFLTPPHPDPPLSRSSTVAAMYY